MSNDVVVLRGGSRDGESTTVEAGVRRLLAASGAPGLLDVYEDDGQTEQLDRNDGPARVFRHVGQETADTAPELQHGPS